MSDDPRRLPLIEADGPLSFPHPSQALDEPDGLLAVGGDLSPRRLMLAYRNGIFPWFSERDPILWWSPATRCVLYPQRLRINRSLAKVLRRAPFELRENTAFTAVVQHCAGPRAGVSGTWITASMIDAYCALHALGHAHSIECWAEGELVGGLYGVRIGRCFFGESMFSHRPDASKVALVQLAQSGEVDLIDCQMATEHLLKMGAERQARHDFLAELERRLG